MVALDQVFQTSPRHRQWAPETLNLTGSHFPSDTCGQTLTSARVLSGRASSQGKVMVLSELGVLTQSRCRLLPQRITPQLSLSQCSCDHQVAAETEVRAWLSRKWAGIGE